MSCEVLVVSKVEGRGFLYISCLLDRFLHLHFLRIRSSFFLRGLFGLDLLLSFFLALIFRLLLGLFLLLRLLDFFLRLDFGRFLVRSFLLVIVRGLLGFSK